MTATTTTTASGATATPVATGTYPGIKIAYYEKPHRRYTVNGEQVPSVTTALGILSKPALMYYSERVTAEGMRVLARRRNYRQPRDMKVPEGAIGFRLPKRVDDDPSNGVWLFKWRDLDRIAESDPSSLIRLKRGSDTLTGTRIALGHLKQLGLDHQSQTGQAAGRGVDVHAVWENWNERGQIPNAADYPEDRRGYIRAMSKFIVEHRPQCHESEMVVGSAVHGFAGRLDTVVVLSLDEGLSMVDLKTSKDVYPSSHFPQLAGYELARRECGLDPTTRQGILRLGADGSYELRWSDAEAEDFLCLLRAWRSQQKWMKKGKR